MLLREEKIRRMKERDERDNLKRNEEVEREIDEEEMAESWAKIYEKKADPKTQNLAMALEDARLAEILATSDSEEDVDEEIIGEKARKARRERRKEEKESRGPLTNESFQAIRDTKKTLVLLKLST